MRIYSVKTIFELNRTILYLGRTILCLENTELLARLCRVEWGGRLLASFGLERCAAARGEALGRDALEDHILYAVLGAELAF